MGTRQKRSGKNQAKRNTRGQFVPGTSGNPQGRPTGTSNLAALRAMLATHVPGLLTQLVILAKSGDVTAIRLVLERVLPPLRAQDEAVTLPALTGTLTERGAAILAEMVSGNVTPQQAGELLSAISAQGKLREADELEKRIRSLEEKLSQPGARQ